MSFIAFFQLGIIITQIIYSENLKEILIIQSGTKLTTCFVFVSSFNQVIAKKVRELLGIEEPYWNRSISLLHRESLGLFLEKKSNTGVEADLLTFEDYKRQLQRQEQSKQTKR